MRSLAVFLAATCALAAGCTGRTAPPATPAESQSPGTGSAAPAERGADEAGAWRPFDLGSHHRTVSTTNPAAQRAFDQGLVWSYAFNHDEAVRAFEEAARHDPRLAMAWWGIALVNGPHINNPVLDQEHAKAAWEALQQARRRLGGASPVERALVGALGARYAWPPPADRAPLDAAYAAAMADVRRQFPDDADVAALYAEALMDTRPWDQWTDDGKPQPGTAETIEALEAAVKLDPNHPGALHLLIHAVEASPQPERAEAAAERLRRLVPDSSHLVHMPAHIAVRLGRWSDAARDNERAVEADRRYAARQPKIGFYAMYMAHNVHFLGYSSMMEGRREATLRAMDDVLGQLTPDVVRANRLFLDAYLTVGLDARKRFGRWDEILAAPLPAEEFPVARAHAHFARAVSHAAKDQLDEAGRERAAFHAALQKVPKDANWGSNKAADVLRVAVPYLDGEIAYRRQNLDLAAAKLMEAVQLEDALKYDEPPAWTTPSRHALGAVLLAADRHAEAEEVYREDLRQYPENGWSLHGLSRSLRAAGRLDEAQAVEGRFRRAWARADTPIGTSCLCVER